MIRQPILAAALTAWVFACVVERPLALPLQARDPHGPVMFQTSDSCLACHNNLTTPAGEDVSIGVAWRASMMANSARDPYWQASVRREALDHPLKVQAIEDGCATCHMPMSRAAARASGRAGDVFRLLPSARDASPEHRLAADGVSCALCHQIGPDRLGTRESFVGGFVVTPGAPQMFGPFDVDAGRTAIMRSATGATPIAGEHVRRSELCATCHTLYTEALGPTGEVVGSLPEQVPFLEWRHSSYREERSCQSCHMPAVESTPMASVLGEPRERLGRHTFLGGNFLMLRMLNRHRAELGVAALPQELEAAAQATLRQLQLETATVSIASARAAGGVLELHVQVRNLTGHKLPTGYPARRVWLHVTVRDQSRVLFESGATTAAGAIVGNDNDADPLRFEPHYAEIRRPDQVQIYESIMGDPSGAVTTGLLRATQYLKDNRLLPRGFRKQLAPADIAVVGGAAADPDFQADGDSIRYVIDVRGTSPPFDVSVDVRFQPIGFRWVENLRSYAAPEPRRFVSFFDAMATASSAVLSSNATVVR